MWSGEHSDWTMYLVVFLNFEFHENNPKYAQSIVKRIRDEGHGVTLFASTPKGRIYPVLEEPRSLFTAALGKKAAPLVQNRISKSDAVILLTEKPVYEIPSHLHNLKGVCSGRVYLWCSYGVCCALLGGSVNNKRVAMQLRALLEDSDNLLGRILPRPWNLEKMYNVDPKFETGEPCVT